MVQTGEMRNMLLPLGVILMGFYLLPLLIRDTGSAMLILLIAIPLICFICSTIYGIKKGFNILYSAIVSVLFVPSIFIFYNLSAWGYIIGYGIIALIGNAIGALIFKYSK